jgi:hypothetical protein
MKLNFSRLIIAIPVIALALALSLSIIACSQKVYQDNNSAATGGDAVPNQIPTQNVASPVNTVDAANPDIVKLFARQGQVKSLSFDFAKLPVDNVIGTYSVKGDLASIKPTTNAKTSKFDIVYIDNAAKTAVAYCTVPGCTDKNQAIAQSYDDWSIPMPLDWASDIQYGKIIGTITYSNKQVTRIEYQKGSLFYEVYIDNYFGYPQRIAISDDSSFKNIVGGYEYKNMAFNNVQDSNVVHS